MIRDFDNTSKVFLFVFKYFSILAVAYEMEHHVGMKGKKIFSFLHKYDYEVFWETHALIEMYF